MTLQLIPVLEIYEEHINKLPALTPILDGLPFYALDSIADGDLSWWINQQLQDARHEDEGIELKYVAALAGGYLLKQGDKLLAVPGGCASLSDLASWLNLAKGNIEDFYQGHPAPIITLEHGNLCFTWQPESPCIDGCVEHAELIKAVAQLEKDVQQLAKRIESITKNKALAQVLVYGKYA